MSNPRAVVPYMWLEPFTPQGGSLTSPSSSVPSACVGSSDLTAYILFLLSSVSIFLDSFGSRRGFLPISRLFSVKVVSHEAVLLVCLRGEVSLASFHCNILVSFSSWQFFTWNFPCSVYWDSFCLLTIQTNCAEPCVQCVQSYPTLCNPMDCRPPGSSVHRIFQARILGWVAISFSRRSSWTCVSLVSCIGRWILCHWATSLSLSCIGEGNGNPFQCSCLENPRDGGAWWAAIYGVTQSRTWLKWLSSSSVV